MSTVFSAAAIAAQLPGLALDVAVVDITGSTNADLQAEVARLSRPKLLIAEQQTAGRGRAGREWLSRAGASATFSLAWRLRGPLPRLLGLPLAVGVALADAFAELGVAVQLKWPNDILKDGRKLGGVLIETSLDGDGVWTVIGVGLNLLVPDELERQIGKAVADAPWLAQLDRNTLMAVVARHLCTILVQFDADGFAPFVARWNRLHAHQGREVVIVDGERMLHAGEAQGVDASGRLLLASGGGVAAIAAGDVSLREAGQA
jgi:BirA family biotin operon repressor/biotin-[acetyl-CoA-carboxylase] ligase